MRVFILFPARCQYKSHSPFLLGFESRESPKHRMLGVELNELLPQTLSALPISQPLQQALPSHQHTRPFPVALVSWSFPSHHLCPVRPGTAGGPLSLLAEGSELGHLPVKCSSVPRGTAARSEPAPQIFPVLMSKRRVHMADVLGEGPQQCCTVQEHVQLLAARQEPWGPLPDIMEHCLCLP